MTRITTVVAFALLLLFPSALVAQVAPGKSEIDGYDGLFRAAATGDVVGGAAGRYLLAGLSIQMMCLSASPVAAGDP